PAWNRVVDWRLRQQPPGSSVSNRDNRQTICRRHAGNLFSIWSKLIRRLRGNVVSSCYKFASNEFTILNFAPDTSARTQPNPAPPGPQSNEKFPTRIGLDGSGAFPLLDAGSPTRPRTSFVPDIKVCASASL